MDEIHGRAGLRPEHGPLFVVVGVFDGLHRGHAYLLEHLVRESADRGARPTVITFDAHPDAILRGQAPPLLLDPAERVDRLAAMGVEVVVVEHFDDELRRTSYDTFVRGIADGAPLAGFLMTPDAAFGHERAGTPQTLTALGRTDGFEVVVVPPFALDGREVRSSEIRSAIAAGDLATAERLLGRPYGIGGTLAGDHVRPPLPIAIPPAGTYPVLTATPSGDGPLPDTLLVAGEQLRLAAPRGGDGGTVRITFVAAG